MMIMDDQCNVLLLHYLWFLIVEDLHNCCLGSSYISSSTSDFVQVRDNKSSEINNDKLTKKID